MILLLKFFRNKRLFVLLTSFMLFIALMGYTFGIKQSLSWPEKFVKDVTALPLSIFYKSADSIAGLFKEISRLRTIHEENRQLKIAVAHYIRDRAKYNFMEKENERLKSALQFTEQQKKVFNYEYKIANVIALGTNVYDRTVTIDLGETHGVKKDMAVVSTQGFVGKISKASAFTSTVQLYTQLSVKNAAISATVLGQEANSFGMVELYNVETKMLEMNMIDPDDILKPGDTIVSSGKGRAFPRGIVLGKVVTRQVGNQGIAHTASIKPNDDLSDLNELFVVIPRNEEQA